MGIEYTDPTIVLAGYAYVFAAAVYFAAGGIQVAAGATAVYRS